MTDILSIYGKRSISKRPWGRALGGSAVLLGIVIAKTTSARSADSSEDLVVAFSALGDQLKMMNALSQFDGIRIPDFAVSNEAKDVPALYFSDPRLSSYAWHGAESLIAAFAGRRRNKCKYHRALVPFPFVTQPIALAYALSQAEEVVAADPQPGVNYAGDIARVNHVRIGKRPWHEYFRTFFRACYPDASLRLSPKLRDGLIYRGHTGSRVTLHLFSAAPEKSLPGGIAREMLRYLGDRGFDAVVLGSQAQRQAVDALCSGTKAEPACGLPLGAVASLLTGSRLFIGVDSSIMNLADAIGVPSVIIYGPTEPEVVGPFYAQYMAVQPEVRTFVIDTESTVGKPSDSSIARIDASRILASIDALLTRGTEVSGNGSTNRAMLR